MSSTDLERSRQFVNASGDVLTLDSPTEDLAGYLADVRDLESQLREEKAIVNRELLARLDKQAKWTVHASGLSLSAPSPEPAWEWDGAGLHAALTELADQDIISTDAVNAAVEIEHVYKVRKAGVSALWKIPALRGLIDQFREPKDKARYVKVTRT